MFTFDEEKHQYTLDGKVIPSVTQILQAEGIIDSYGSEWHRLKGKYIHQAIALYLEDNLNEDSLDPQLNINGFKKFLEESKFEVQGFERSFYHPQYHYAGTVDMWGVLNGKVILIDIKSGSPARWHVLQLSAYAELLRVNGIVVKAVANLYLNGNNYNLKPVSTIEWFKGWNIFLSALTLYKWKLST